MEEENGFSSDHHRCNGGEEFGAGAGSYRFSCTSEEADDQHQPLADVFLSCPVLDVSFLTRAQVLLFSLFSV